MKKSVISTCLLLMLLALPAQAQVVLPESGRLAGPLNTAISEIGTEFVFAPEVWGTAPPGRSAQSGWIEIQFGEPEGTLAPFRLEFKGIGPDVLLEFTGGQQFVYGEQTVETFDSLGILNLETGTVEDIFVGALFNDTGIARNSVTNRTSDVFLHTYPPEPSPLPIDGLPPGFIHAVASFSYDAQGRITGFFFSGGGGFTPFGLLGVLPVFPEYSFGAFNQATAAAPLSCVEGTPPENCPDERTARNGIPLPPFPFDDPDTPPTLIRPHTIVESTELREVPVKAVLPSCAVSPRADAVGAALARKLYQIGGAARGRDRGRVDVFDTSTESWERGPTMAVPVSEAQGEVLDGKIYIVGGRRAPRGPAVDILQVFDPETASWSRLTSAPLPVANAATAAKGDRLYVFGGETNRRNGSPSGNLRFADTLQIYDVASDSWQILDLTVEGAPLYVADASAVADGHNIFLINGRSVDDQVTDQVLIFDTLNQVFSPGVPTLEGVYDASAERVGKRIYLSGGRTEYQGDTRRRLQIFEPEQGAWHRGLDPPVALAASASATADGRLYLVGGRTMAEANVFPGQDSGVLQYYDPGRGWKACNSYPIFTSGDVLSTAALLVGPVELAPGAQATVLGQHLATSSAMAPPDEDVPTDLAGVQITIDGEPAPILAVSPTRIDFQIPYDVQTSRGQAELVIERAGAASPPVEIALAPAAPHIFIQYCDSARQIFMQRDASSIACQPDGSLNYPDNPVSLGGSVLVQMTGLGAVDTALRKGERAPARPPAQALQLPSVLIEHSDGSFAPATVIGATLAPGEIGIYDVEIQVPNETFVSDRTFLTATQGGITSNRAGIAVGTPVTDSPVGCLRDSNPFFRACILDPGENAGPSENPFFEVDFSAEGAP